jgi:hypothetical protein
VASAEIVSQNMSPTRSDDQRNRHMSRRISVPENSIALRHEPRTISFRFLIEENGSATLWVDGPRV